MQMGWRPSKKKDQKAPKWSAVRRFGFGSLNPTADKEVLFMSNITVLFSDVNTMWTLIGAALVFFMQAGFAMAESGFTRSKNAGNIIMKNLMDFSIGTPVISVTEKSLSTMLKMQSRFAPVRKAAQLCRM